MTPSSSLILQPARAQDFKFKEYSGEALLDTVKLAITAFHDSQKWQTLMRNGMAQDYSWAASAREYVKVYERVKQGRPIPIAP